MHMTAAIENSDRNDLSGRLKGTVRAIEFNDVAEL
jgi:hypothetical protein